MDPWERTLKACDALLTICTVLFVVARMGDSEGESVNMPVRAVPCVER